MAKYDKNYYADRILSRIDREKYDVEYASPLYIMTGPNAEEFANAHKESTYTIEQVFPTTQDREHLIEDAKTYKIAPHESTPAVAEGEFNIKVNTGERFSKDEINFTVTEDLGKRTEDGYYLYSLTAEESGDVGNVAPGTLVPIRTVNGLKHAELTRILVPGENEEETEEFRERYLDSFVHKPFCGNGADYMKELGELSGVGRSKVLRCRNLDWEIDPEWVGLVFTDSEFNAPTQELVDEVQEYFHPLGPLGIPEIETSGTGLSGIGQLVHVHGVRETKIDIEVSLRFETGSNWGNMTESIRENLEEFLLGLREKWGDVLYTKKAKAPLDDCTEIIRTPLLASLLEIKGVLDATDLKINGAYENYTLDWDSVPVLGEVTENKDVEEPDEGDCPCTCPDCMHNRHAECCARLKGVV